jgi:hypothetical protein
MKKIIFSGLLFCAISSVNSQEAKIGVLKDPEQMETVAQAAISTATIKSATRLFKDKDDLTSVILVVPPDSVVNVLGSDDTFLHVVFEDNEGYIYTRHAEINKSPVLTNPAVTKSTAAQDEGYVQEIKPVPRQKISRYAYLENKYGSSLAARLYEGKIWRGMNAQMVKDSWGSPKKINRVISGNTVKEEWFYNNTWLSFQNSTLTQWGLVRD